MPKRIYAIYDNVADSIIGGLHVHAHPAAAIRMFGDIACMTDSSIGRHPGDFDLICLGVIGDDNVISPLKETTLSGATWAAAQTPHLEKEA